MFSLQSPCFLCSALLQANDLQTVEWKIRSSSARRPEICNPGSLRQVTKFSPNGNTLAVAKVISTDGLYKRYSELICGRGYLSSSSLLTNVLFDWQPESCLSCQPAASRTIGIRSDVSGKMAICNARLLTQMVDERETIDLEPLFVATLTSLHRVGHRMDPHRQTWHRFQARDCKLGTHWCQIHSTPVAALHKDTITQEEHHAWELV